MRKVLITVILALAILALPILPAVAQGGQAEVAEVFIQTEEVRELTAGQDVKADYLSKNELRDKLAQDFEEKNPEEELRDTQDMMVMLGFIDEDLDLRRLLLDLYTEQVAGFYDPEDDSLYLISDEKDKMSAMDRYTLSHELTHYLQDQNFDIMRPPFNDPEGTPVAGKTDDDASFAASCLVEGDASLTSDTWGMEHLNAADVREMQSESGEYSTDVFDSAPEYIQDSLLFPYQEGMSFVSYIHRKGGYDAIDRAYKDPPKSTEQIYHPEKYMENEPVVEVELPDLTGSLGDGWELAYDNVLGEFDVYELFKPYFSAKTAKLAAEGWGGNRYQYYRSDEGDKLLVQGYAWDSEGDAQEFSSAYVKYVEDRFEGKVDGQSSRGAWKVWSTGGYVLALKKDGLNTYLVQATNGDYSDTAVAALGEKGDQIEESAIGEEAKKKPGEETNLSWLVIAGVIVLLVAGLVLVIVMLILFRRPPAPPSLPPGGPYIYPGGGPGPYYGGPGGTGGTGPGGVPWMGGQVPPPAQPPPRETSE